VKVARPVRRAGRGNGPVERPAPRPGPTQHPGPGRPGVPGGGPRPGRSHRPGRQGGRLTAQKRHNLQGRTWYGSRPRRRVGCWSGWCGGHRRRCGRCWVVVVAAPPSSPRPTLPLAPPPAAPGRAGHLDRRLSPARRQRPAAPTPSARSHRSASAAAGHSRSARARTGRGHPATAGRCATSTGSRPAPGDGPDRVCHAGCWQPGAVVRG